MNDYKILINTLKERYAGYAATYRSSIQPFKFQQIKKYVENIDLQDEAIRESLIEHVGHLPITAATLFPYIDDQEVDLGKTLIMLSIHDIGEIVVGDKMIFKKTQADSNEEVLVVHEILEPLYHDSFEDVEHQITKNGKFAKSVDKMVADIMELVLTADVSRQRYKLVANLNPEEIVPSKRNSKMKFMMWNKFLEGFYDYLLVELDKHLTTNN